MRQARTIATVVVVLALCGAGAASAQDDGEYALGGDPSGYDPSGGGDGGYGEGGAGNSGRVKLELTAKKKQKSLKAVKVKATCENRACTVDAKGKLKAGGDKAKLKPDEESLMSGETDSMKLKLAKKAKRAAKAAASDDEKLKVKVTGRAKGVGGGGTDKASVKIKLKP